MRQMTIDEIRVALVDRKLTTVSERTGLHINTVREVANGTQSNPTWRTMMLLSDYLQGKNHA